MTAALLCTRCRCDLAAEQPIPAGLKPRRATVLRYLRAYLAEHGYPPSVREVMVGVGLESPSSAHFQLRALEAAGLIERAGGGVPRALRLVDEPPAMNAIRLASDFSDNQPLGGRHG